MAANIKLKRSAVAGRIPSADQLELGEVAINTADGKMYIKRDVNGTETVVLVNDAQEGVWKQYAYTATAGQTTFSSNDDNSQVLSYSIGYAEVYLNGILLDPAIDYTANTGYEIELTSPASLDDLIQIDSFASTIGPGDIVVNTFTGDNSTVSFTLTADAGVEQNVSVFIDGVYQEKDTYSLSGTSLVFGEAPYTDASIEAVIGSRNITITEINDLTITGDISAQGTISGNSFSGTSATLTGALASGSVTTGNIGSSGTIDADGDITTLTDVNANNVVATNDITATGSITAPNLLVSNWNTAYGWGDHSTQSYATESSVNTAIDARVDTAFISNLIDATDVDYDNTVSGISANTVQEAIDYLNTLSGGSQGDVASYTREKFTATADQTTFTLADGYTLGYLEVFLNGILLDVSDYTANDESTVVLAEGAKAGDELITIALDSFAIAELLRVTSISASAPDDAITIDADGSLSVAGLSVDGDAEISGTASRLYFTETDATDKNTRLVSSGGDFYIQTSSDDKATNTPRISLDHATGDVSFYGSTGVNKRFDWDASLEGLRIGPQPNTDSAIVISKEGVETLLRFGSLQPENYGLKVRQRLQGRNTSGSAYYGDILFDPQARKLSLTAYHSDPDALVLDSSGNVGIGTDSPILPLDVHGGTIGVTSTTAFAGLQITAKNNSFAYVNFGDEDDGNVGQINYNHVDNNMKFITNNSPRLTINSTGLVGIRTTDPQDWLHVVGTSSGAATFKHYYSYAAPNYCLKIQGQDNTPNGYIQQNPAQGGLLLTNGLTYYGAGNWVVDANTTDVTTMSMQGDHFSFNVREDVTAGSTIGAPAQVCRIDANGITAPNGIIFGDAGGSGSSTSNTLDSYEEGVWTPAITTSGGTVTTDGTTCRYTKIGRVVHVAGQIGIDSVSSPTGKIQITLPFTARVGSAFQLAYASMERSATKAHADFTALVFSNHSYFRIYLNEYNTLSSSNPNAQQITTNSQIQFGFSYSAD